MDVLSAIKRHRKLYSFVIKLKHCAALTLFVTAENEGKNLPFLLYLHGIFNLADDIEVDEIENGEF